MLVFYYMYIISLISILFLRKHLLMCLISLEFIIISLMMVYLNYFYMYNNGFYLMVMMMVFFVCEGVLGLSIMVSLIRCYSNDYLNSLILW
nr:NADH dehydrogenase subunit 4L [Nelidina sp. n.]